MVSDTITVTTRPLSSSAEIITFSINRYILQYMCSVQYASITRATDFLICLWCNMIDFSNMIDCMQYYCLYLSLKKTSYRNAWNILYKDITMRVLKKAEQILYLRRLNGCLRFKTVLISLKRRALLYKDAGKFWTFKANIYGIFLYKIKVNS